MIQVVVERWQDGEIAHVRLYGKFVSDNPVSERALRICRAQNSPAKLMWLEIFHYGRFANECIVS